MGAVVERRRNRRRHYTPKETRILAATGEELAVERDALPTSVRFLEFVL
jgi:hypothetical protein